MIDKLNPNGGGEICEIFVKSHQFFLLLFFDLEPFARVVLPDLLERAFDLELLSELSESRARVLVTARQSAADTARANRMILILSNNRLRRTTRLPIAPC
jgi:hypothetical protein